MIPNPHDALFKGVLGTPEHARGVLRTLVPAALAEALDWQTLTLCPGSFVDEALQEQHTDLLYSTAWRDGGDVIGAATARPPPPRREMPRRWRSMTRSGGTWRPA